MAGQAAAAKPPKPTQMQGVHPIMECPVCHVMIEAVVELEVVLGLPTVDAVGAASVPLSSRPVRWNVSHPCQGPIDQVAEPTGGA